MNKPNTFLRVSTNLLIVAGIAAASIFGTLWWMKRGSSDAGSPGAAIGAQPDETRIRARLLASSERHRAADIAAAEAAVTPAERRRLRDRADAAHDSREARIDDAVDRLLELGGTGATPTARELLRIVRDEGVDQGLAYVGRERAGVLADAGAQLATDRDAVRARLAPLLSAADLQAAAGQTVAARAGYQELVQRDPAWPVALSAAAWFLYGQSIQAESHGTLAAAITDATEALALAGRRHAAESANPPALRVFAATLNQMGDVLRKRDRAGDSDKAAEHYARGLEIREKLLAANPSSAQAMRNLSIVLNNLAGLLSKRGQPGDVDRAIGYYTRDLEISENLLKADPDSTSAKRGVSISLDRLGTLLSKRGQPGDMDRAVSLLSRDLQLCESILKADPSSARASRDVSISLEMLGDVFAKRGKSGDGDKALAHYARSLEIRENLLTADPASAKATRDLTVVLNKLGDFLTTRAQPGDAEKALAHFRRALEAREKLLAANPGSADTARDVWVSAWKLGNHAERTGKGDPRGSWRRAYDILAWMKESGMPVPPEDVRVLEDLRAKIAQ